MCLLHSIMKIMRMFIVQIARFLHIYLYAEIVSRMTLYQHDEDAFVQLMLHRINIGANTNSLQLPTTLCQLIAEYCLHCIHFHDISSQGFDLSRDDVLNILKNQLGTQMTITFKLPSIEVMTQQLIVHNVLHLPLVGSSYELEFIGERYCVPELLIGLTLDNSFTLSLSITVLGNEISWILGDFRQMCMSQGRFHNLITNVLRVPAKSAEFRIRPSLNGQMLPTKQISSLKGLSVDNQWFNGEIEHWRFWVGVAQTRYHYGEADMHNGLVYEFKIRSLVHNEIKWHDTALVYSLGWLNRIYALVG